MQVDEDGIVEDNGESEAEECGESETESVGQTERDAEDAKNLCEAGGTEGENRTRRVSRKGDTRDARLIALLNARTRCWFRPPRPPTRRSCGGWRRRWATVRGCEPIRARQENAAGRRREAAAGAPAVCEERASGGMSA
eukprot:4702742-Prymnesium_polylepis.2